MIEPATAVTAVEVLEELEVVGEGPRRSSSTVVLAPPGAREENAYVAGERLTAGAASPATRRQYASIYRTFGDRLRGQLARPPVTSDLTGDAIAAFGRHFEQAGRTAVSLPGGLSKRSARAVAAQAPESAVGAYLSVVLTCRDLCKNICTLLLDRLGR